MLDIIEGWVVRFFILLNKLEHVIGRSTGMNPVYLSRIREDTTRMQGWLHRVEVRRYGAH